MRLRLDVGFICAAILWTAAAPGLGAELPRRAVLGAGVAGENGVHVTFVVPDSAAARAGLKAGDAVTSIEAAAPQTAAAFIALVKSEPTGKPLDFHIVRDGVARTLAVTLAPAPEEHDPQVRTSYESVSVDGSLRRTLVTVPTAEHGKYPAVLILGGIGCFSVDNAADAQDAYMRLAHDLGRDGIVTMRLEKSGIGDSQGAACTTVDLLSEMRSYDVALSALRSHAHVDGSRIYLFGHSIGTLMAPRIANKGGIAGVIIADGVGRNWIEYELINLRRQLELGGDAPAKIDAIMADKEFCMHGLLIEKQPEADLERVRPACKDLNTYPAPAGYLQQAAALNIAEPWTNFALPLLAIYGSGDFITDEADHHRIVAIVNATPPGSAALTVIPGMDHHFDVAGTQQQAYDLRVKNGKSGPYDAQLSNAVLDWLCAREACLKPKAG